jgi:hypothetical protein
MMSMSPLKKCNVVAYIDKDSAKQNKAIHGRRVKPPDILHDAGADSVVVVWGGPYHQSIERDLNQMGYKGKILMI